MVSLGKLVEIKDLRTVWPHEALDFTPWLSQDDNIALLADAVYLCMDIVYHSFPPMTRAENGDLPPGGPQGLWLPPLRGSCHATA